MNVRKNKNYAILQWGKSKINGISEKSGKWKLWYIDNWKLVPIKIRAKYNIFLIENFDLDKWKFRK